MGPVQAIKTSLSRSFQYSGRASRPEYWWFLPVGLAIPTLTVWLLITQHSDTPFLWGVAYFFLALSPLMAVTKRRLNDTDEWAVWFLIPLKALVLFILALWATGAVSDWAQAEWAAGADGPAGFGVAIAAVCALLILLPVALYQFFIGLTSGSALFGQMTVPSSPGPNRYGPNPLEASK